jgi:hypothetical protein
MISKPSDRSSSEPGIRGRVGGASVMGGCGFEIIPLWPGGRERVGDGGLIGRHSVTTSPPVKGTAEEFLPKRGVELFSNRPTSILAAEDVRQAPGLDASQPRQILHLETALQHLQPELHKLKICVIWQCHSFAV